jgi:hypothetical protein
MAALTLGAWVTRAHALVTHEPSIGRIILYSHCPLSTEGLGTCLSTRAPPVWRGGVWSYSTPEPTAEAGRGPKPQDVWQHWIPPMLGG